MVVNTMQIESSLRATVYPKTEEQKIFGPLYLLSSVVGFILLYLYYYRKWNTAYAVTILVIIRTNIRQFDLQNTQSI